jgi:hypothetical protein
MRYSIIIFVALLSISTLNAIETVEEVEIQAYEPGSNIEESNRQYNTDAIGGIDQPVLTKGEPLVISVVGQGVAPTSTESPAQAYALAKRAAIADAYRLIAEKVKGVRVNGRDVIKNMMVKRSTVRTAVYAMVKNASVVETVFKEGLCEVEMEITISYADFAQ